jgi:hypothetical protein
MARQYSIDHGKMVSNLRYDHESGIRFELKIDTRAMKQWALAWKKFARQSGKWAQKFINDEAFKFRFEVYKAIQSNYVVRDRRFVNNAVIILKARLRTRMEDIRAVVATAYGEGGSSIRFSGFEEELTGSPSTVARPHHRVITDAGRKGRTFVGKSYGWARMHRGNQ